MENRVNDFIVNSKGHCFFCLGRIQHPLTAPVKLRSDTEWEPSALHSLQNVSRYLKMDMTKVFSQKGSIPPSLLAKVEQSRLKVELCEECANWNISFSILFRQWEKLGMHMESKLGLIQEKMATRADETGRFVKSEGGDEGVKQQVVEVLRVEAMDKCNRKMGHPGPRIKLQKLTRKEIKAHLKIKTTNPRPESNNRFLMQTKTEEIVWNVEDDRKAESFHDIDDNNEEDSLSISRSITAAELQRDTDSQTAKEENLHISTHMNADPPLTSTQRGEKNYSINTSTRKFKCNLCSKEFGSHVGFRYHYKSVHLKIKYKCNLCGKEFANKPNYNTHLRSSHLGVRFKCTVCNTQFTSKQNLQFHQRKNTCNGEDGRNL